MCLFRNKLEINEKKRQNPCFKQLLHTCQLFTMIEITLRDFLVYVAHD
jgi:hypothetical protein